MAEEAAEVKEKSDNPPGVALDVGTMFCLSARKKDGKFQLKKLRNVFLDLDSSAKKSLKLSKVNFIDKGDSVVLLGDDALAIANLFNQEVRRPLNKGVVSPSELDAVDILTTIFSQLLGKRRGENEPCYYSVPANPLDSTYNVIYHQAVIGRIITGLGFAANAMNEGQAVVYSNCSKEDFSGIGISFGAGMTNACLCWKSLSAMEFSVARGGDWIDSNSSHSTATTASRIAAVKEKGVNLLDWTQGDPKEARYREAIAVHYKSLILYVLDNFVREFKKVQQAINLPESIPIVISGGTSCAPGFVDLFKEALDSFHGFPVQISEVRHATNPIGAVAEGLLVAALGETA